jgi:hypothetical protein
MFSMRIEVDRPVRARREIDMLKGLQRYITLWIKTGTGLSSGFLIAVMTGAADVMVFVFLALAGYAWLSMEFGPVFGGLAMAGAFLLVAGIGVGWSALSQRQTKQRALLERATRTPGPSALLHPALLNGASGRIVPMALLAFLAAQGTQEARYRRTR